MPELRWILLVLGALLIAGLWWWELQRSRAKDAPPPVEQEPHRAPERHEPTFGDYESGDATDESELPAMRADERPVPRGDPPVVTIDDLPEDVDQVVLASEAPEPRRFEPISARRDPPGVAIAEAIAIDPAEQSPSERAALPPIVAAPAPSPDVRPHAVHSRPAPTVAAAPAAAAAPSAPSRVPAAEPAGLESRRPAARATPARAPATSAPPVLPEEPKPKPAEPPSPLQKIVALRLVGASGERIDGGLLRAALEAEGLRFGKYSIFHRQRADGKAIYSAASLLEPGSFDLDRMHLERYPGISLFAVFPGPLDAPQAFDELLATARRLSERLDAVPQDERGAPLGAQRALAIREELVHFQGLVQKTRARPGA
jgi:FtsZ-interacting cell division protein ZipA